MIERYLRKMILQICLLGGRQGMRGGRTIVHLTVTKDQIPLVTANSCILRSARAGARQQGGKRFPHLAFCIC